MNMSGNTILITGGTSGIGFEMARILSNRNKILITGRDPVKLRSTEKSIPDVKTYLSDVSDPIAISKLYQQVAQEFPELNILINNAGVMRAINFHETQVDLAQLTSEIETNLSGPIRMTKEFLPLLKKQKEAMIMNVSSLLAFVPMAITPVYSATKAGLHSFTLSLRIQLQGTSVRVFELAPPPTVTSMLTDTFGAEGPKGIPQMDVLTLAKTAIKGLENDNFEICPGLSSTIKTLSRLAPNTALKSVNKSTQAVFASPR